MKGDCAKWDAALARLCAPGQHANSFLAMLSAGAPLHRLMTDEGGTVVSIVSPSPSRDAAVAAALSIWGNPADLWKGYYQDKGGIPLGFPALSVKEVFRPQDMAIVMRFTAGAATFESPWSTFMLTSSSVAMPDKPGSVDGPWHRVLQLMPDLNQRVPDHDGKAALAFFAHNYGWGAPRINAALADTDIDVIRADLIKRNADRMVRLELPNAARFKARAITCAELGGYLLQRTCLQWLDVPAVIAAVEKQVYGEYYKEIIDLPGADLISQFVNDKKDEIVYTRRWKAMTKGIQGRYDPHRRGQSRLYLIADKFRAWLSERGATIKQAEAEAARLGNIMSEAVIDVTARTGMPMHRAKCYMFSLDAVTESVVRNALLLRDTKRIKGVSEGSQAPNQAI